MVKQLYRTRRWCPTSDCVRSAVPKTATWKIDDSEVMTMTFAYDCKKTVMDLEDTLVDWLVPFDSRCDGMITGPFMDDVFAWSRPNADGSIQAVRRYADGSSGPKHRKLLEQILSGEIDQAVSSLQTYIASLEPPVPLESISKSPTYEGADALEAFCRTNADWGESLDILLDIPSAYPKLASSLAQLPELRRTFVARLSQYTCTSEIDELFKKLRFKVATDDLVYLNPTSSVSQPAWLLAQYKTNPASETTVAWLRSLACKEDLGTIARRAKAGRLLL